MKKASLILLLFAACTFYACKKDRLVVNEEKTFSQVDHKSTNIFDAGWRLTLKPGGVADLLPGGDVSYRGTYAISGSRIKVKTEQNMESYEFEILSDTDIKEKQSGTLLRLQGK